MKKLTSLLNDAKQIIFMDFEGTQLTQEIIAIGAVKAELDNKKQIKKLSKPFKVFITSEGVVGPFVENLTGITDLYLFQYGIPFEEAIEKFKTYVGKDLNFTSFMTFGRYDMRLLHETALLNNLEEDDFVNKIYTKNIDFTSVFSKFVRSEKSEQLSLADACKIFNLEIKGNLHDPEYDAINLAYLYDAFLREKSIVREEYLKVIKKNPHLPSPLIKALHRLESNGSITFKELLDYIDEEIK